jgi:hypothetical protein
MTVECLDQRKLGRIDCWPSVCCSASGSLCPNGMCTFNGTIQPFQPHGSIPTHAMFGRDRGKGDAKVEDVASLPLRQPSSPYDADDELGWLVDLTSDQFPVGSPSASNQIWTVLQCWERTWIGRPGSTQFFSRVAKLSDDSVLIQAQKLLLHPSADNRKPPRRYQWIVLIPPKSSSPTPGGNLLCHVSPGLAGFRFE